MHLLIGRKVKTQVMTKNHKVKNWAQELYFMVEVFYCKRENWAFRSINFHLHSVKIKKFSFYPYTARHVNLYKASNKNNNNDVQIYVSRRAKCGHKLANIHVNRYWIALISRISNRILRNENVRNLISSTYFRELLEQ